MVWSGVHDNDPAERWLRGRIAEHMAGGGWFIECISVAAVTAAYGSALTAGHFCKGRNAGPAKSNQKAFAPPLGASPRLGMPVIRH